MDVQIYCHFVVLLIKMFRDFYPQLECPLHLTGSDGADIVSSKIRERLVWSMHLIYEMFCIVAEM